MELNYLNTLPTGGFNFDNCIRNKAMAESAGMSQPVKTMKTGTTICGIIYEVRKKRKHTKITKNLAIFHFVNQNY
jgi:invasion protein IalB